MTFAELVAEVLEVDSDDIVDAAGPETLSSWTSLRHLQLVVTLEEHYQLSFNYSEIRSVKSIGELRSVLRGKGVDA